jgi:hypothetical protein
MVGHAGVSRRDLQEERTNILVRRFSGMCKHVGSAFAIFHNAFRFGAGGKKRHGVRVSCRPRNGRDRSMSNTSSAKPFRICAGETPRFPSAHRVRFG